MESSAHQHGGDHGGRSGHATRGRLLDRGWRYDLEVWFADTFLLRGGVRALRRRVLELAGVRAGQAVLDVGCGTGTLAIEAAARIGRSGRVAGIDPAPRQIARARSKARRAGLSIDFQPGVIEAIPFADGSFGAVTSTLMMHHLPEDLRHQGLSEILRVLQPGGSLVVADFTGPHAQALAEPIRSAGFTGVESEEMPFPRVHGNKAGVALVLGRKP